MDRQWLNHASAIALAAGCLSGNTAQATEFSPTIPTASYSQTSLEFDYLELQLDVNINDYPSGFVASFRQTRDGALQIQKIQLINIGVKVDRDIADEEWINLATLPGVTFTVLEDKQEVNIYASEAKLIPRRVDLRPRPKPAKDDPIEDIQSDSIGALFNYSLYGSTGGNGWDGISRFDGASGSTEARIFSKLGTFSSSQAIKYSDSNSFEATRFDTRWTYSDTDRMLEVSGGDFIAGGLSWTRPVRLGGIQLRRNFSLQPDLVTIPLPDMSGSAAVPSTVDVYVNNVRRTSQSVQPGPFTLTNLPIVTGGGTVKMVVRDALGRETLTETPFYTTSEHLAKGMLDFSVDLGFARRYFGTESNNYDSRPVGSTTFRYGLSNLVTLEGHAELASNFYNVGFGATTSIGSIGAITVAGARSQFESEIGYLISANAEFKLWNSYLRARTTRTFDAYNDIASITAVSRKDTTDVWGFSSKPAKAIDQITWSLPDVLHRTSLSFSFIHLERQNQSASNMLSISASKQIYDRGHLYVSTTTDLSHSNSFGIYGGFSWRFDDDIISSTTASSQSDQFSVTQTVSKSAGNSPGDYGWRVRGSAGDQTILGAGGTYQSAIGRVEANVEKYNEHVRSTIYADGSLAIGGGDVFLASRVDDTFGVVNAGAPNVEVFHENRLAGKTNQRGRLLLPHLRAYDRNTVSIDPTNLPLDKSLTTTRYSVVPKNRGVASINFTDSSSTRKFTLITLRDEEGNDIEMGSVVTLDGSEDFIVGFDGQVYMPDVLGTNSRVEVSLGSKGRCLVSSATSTENTVSFTPVRTCRHIE